MASVETSGNTSAKLCPVKPQRQAFAGVLDRDAVQFVLKPPFAKVSRAAASALGCAGRAFCRDRPSLRSSLDMWPS